MRNTEANISSIKHNKIRDGLYRRLSLLFAISFIVLTLAGCSKQNEVPELLRYDSYGKNIALNISKNYPRRTAGSEAERATAEYIKKKFQELGYAYTEDVFELNSGAQSSNIIVNIPGKGFVADKDSEEELNQPVYDRRAKSAYGLFERRVIIAARYDSDPEAGEGNDGISDNSSGIGALLTLARALKEYEMGYDITLVALGAGFDNYAGARDLLAKIPAEELKDIDAFYEFRSLYAGSKLYASAGWSSTYPGQKYRLRQPAYELPDVSATEGTYDLLGELVYQNQAGISIPNPLFQKGKPEGFQDAPEKIIFREISSNASDYRVFDEHGIPCVFLEAYDFDGRSMEDIKENNDPTFASTNYIVRGTAFDNIETLAKLSSADLLQARINTAAYVVLKAVETGVIGSVVE